MRKSVLLTLLSFFYCIGIGIFNTALAFNTSPYIMTHRTTHTSELKPIPSEAFQLAKAVFLPDYLGDKFSGYKLDGDYNQKGNCDDKNSLYTTKNCSYPKAVVAASQCPFLPGYYTDCICLSKFKHTSCNSPYILGGDSCDGKYEKCVCPPTVSLNYANDKCTMYCDGQCIEKSCTPDSDETDCQYGTGYTSDGCGGTRIYCKACTPSSDETGCEYGTESCSDGCGGTRTCCSAKPACTSSSSNYCSVHKTCHGDCCTNGTIKSCDTRCGGSGCNSCTPYSDETGCKYGTTSCSDGCGGTRTCCKSPSCTPSPCTGYTLSACPPHANCSSCEKKSSSCAIWTVYKIDSCFEGYEQRYEGSCTEERICVKASVINYGCEKQFVNEQNKTCFDQCSGLCIYHYTSGPSEQVSVRDTAICYTNPDNWLIDLSWSCDCSRAPD